MTLEPPDDLLSAWQNQPVEPPRFSPDEIREKAERFERTIRRRNAVELWAAAFVVVTFGYQAVSAPSLGPRIGAGLVVAGALFVGWHLSSKGRANRVPENSGDCLAFHRDELVRQRDLLRSVWRWYLGPLVPGLAVSMGDTIRLGASRGAVPLAVAIGAASVCALVFVGIGMLNARAARKLDRDIASLEEARSSGSSRGSPS